MLITLPFGKFVESDDPTLGWLWTGMAAIAGAVAALSFMKWEDMTWGQIALTLFVGFSFAIFVTPWAAHTLFGISQKDAMGLCALTYVSATGSNTVLPLMVRWFSKHFGSGDAK